MQRSDGAEETPALKQRSDRAEETPPVERRGCIARHAPAMRERAMPGCRPGPGCCYGTTGAATFTTFVLISIDGFAITIEAAPCTFSG